jgi:hypothetical protein
MHFVSDRLVRECCRGQRASKPDAGHGHHLAAGNALGFILSFRHHPARRHRTEPAGTKSAGHAVPEYSLQRPVRRWRLEPFFRLRFSHGEQFIRRFGGGVQLQHVDVGLDGGIEQRFRHSARRHRPWHAGREPEHRYSQYVRCSVSIVDIRDIDERPFKRDRACRRLLGHLNKRFTN